MRDEFTRLMHQSFLDGRDTEFDYSTVDNDESYDDLDAMERDRQDKYFDDDDDDDEKVEPEENDLEYDY